MGCTSSTEKVATTAPTKTAPSPVKKPYGTTANGVPETTKTVISKPPEQVPTTTNSRSEPEFRTTETVHVKLGDFMLRYACVSKHGKDPEIHKPNQDSYSHSVNFINNETAFFGVYDGHGPRGHDCSQLVKEKLPQLLQKHLTKHINGGEALTPTVLEDCLRRAHMQCNVALHCSTEFSDETSGTTSVTFFLEPEGLTVSNVGDSRAILGTSRNLQQLRTEAGVENKNTNSDGAPTVDVPPPKWTALALTNDQTPKRADEAERCRQAGARILSFGEVNGEVIPEGEDIDDPPRIWAPDGNYPGTAFTRSLGDRVAERLGVIAEPEILSLTLTESEKVLILASDGVYDVLTNQQVIDICATSTDPYQACQAIVQMSEEGWLRNDGIASADDPMASYDDTTVFCLMLGNDDNYFSEELKKDAEESKDKNETETPSTPSRPQLQTEPSKRRLRQKTLRPGADAFFEPTVEE
jgi:serine/threonine protein phosphatase PrpC